MVSGNIRVSRISLFPFGFSFILFLVFLYMVFYFSGQFHIPIIGTLAKWVLIAILGLIGLIIGIMLLVFLVVIFLILFAFLKTSSAKRRHNKMPKKENIEEKIRVLNPSVNSSKIKTKSKAVRKKDAVIVDAEYK
jgi:predicted membrane protein